MGAQDEWIAARQFLSEVSKRYHACLTMPAHLRSQMSQTEYARRCSHALKALNLADDACRSAGKTARRAARMGSYRQSPDSAVAL